MAAGLDQANAVRADFEGLMKVAATHYGQHGFLLGERACLGDFTFAGPLKLMLRQIQNPGWIDQCAPEMLGYMNRVFESRTDDAVISRMIVCQRR